MMQVWQTYQVNEFFFEILVVEKTPHWVCYLFDVLDIFDVKYHKGIRDVVNQVIDGCVGDCCHKGLRPTSYNFLSVFFKSYPSYWEEFLK